MEVFKKPAWWLAALVFAIHQVLQMGLNVRLPVVDDYLDPLLFLPLMLGAFLQEQRWLFGRYRMSGLEVCVAGLALSLIAEEVLPRWQTDFVRDNWDYLFYLLGLFWFWWMINPPKHEDSSVVKVK